MRKAMFVTLIALLTVAALAAVARRYHAQITPSVHPFVATYKITVMHQRPGVAQPVPDRERYLTLAVRSDGTTMQANALPDANGQLPTVRGIAFKDRYVVVDPFTESVSTYHQAVRPIVVSTQDCGGNPDAPILGHPIEVVAQEPNANSKKIGPTVRRWIAVDLNCISLRERYIPNDGSSAVQVDREAVSVKMGEPPAEYFDIPATYQERGPAEVDAEMQKRSGHHVYGNGNPEILDKLQQPYLQARPQ